MDFMEEATFISTMELAFANGDMAFVRQNAAELDALINRIQDLSYELAKLQCRACRVRDQMVESASAGGAERTNRFTSHR